jgi:hypothetical protein
MTDQIKRLARYEVKCAECGVAAAYRTGNALLGPEYGCGFYCILHIPPAMTYPLAIYLLSPPGIAGGDHPGTKIREEWPTEYAEYRKNSKHYGKL